MTQDAIVYKCLDAERAEVVVTRATACGSNCASCEACVFQNELKTVARNLIGARPGQKVLIESKSSRMYGAIMLVETGAHRCLRKIRLLGNSQVLLQSGDREMQADAVHVSDVRFVGRAVRVEFSL